MRYRLAAPRRLVPTAVLAGVVLGVVGRLAMRWIALEAGLEGGGTWTGSLEVVAFGAIVGAPLAFIFLLIRPRLPLGFPWAGVIGGTCIFFLAVALPPPSARSALSDTPDTPAFTALAFLIILVGWMVGLDYLSRRLRGR